MKKMTKFIALLLAVVFVLGLCACGNEAPSTPPTTNNDSPGNSVSDNASADPKEKVVTLTMANSMPSGNPCEEILNWVFNEMYERSGGTIKVEYYANSTLLDAAAMMDGVKSGVADMGYAFLADSPGRFPDLLMAEYPGIAFASAPSITKAMAEYVELYDPAGLEGIKVLAFQNGTTGMIATNVAPIRSPDDLKGQTIRSLGNMAKSVSAFGGTPVDVSIADCYEALRTGVMDGIMTIPGALEGFRLCEVVDYCMVYPLYNNCSLYIMNEDVYNGLSDRQKEAIDSTWADAYEYCFTIYQDEVYSDPATVAAIEIVLENGGEFYSPTDEEIAKFAECVKPIVEEYASSIDNGEEIMSRWFALAEKWNAEYPFKAPDAPDTYVSKYPDTKEVIDWSTPGLDLPY